MDEEKQKIFLEDGSILPWERPIENGFSILDMYNGSTKLVEQVGFDTIEETIGPFKVMGSATKYLANIAHLADGHEMYDTEAPNEPKKEILFSGGIMIYRIGEIPGTKIQGYDFERQGRIWVARQQEDKFCSSDGLRNIILDNSPNPVDRIEAILSGYQFQEDGEERAQSEREHSNWENGLRQGPDEGFMYRGGGPC